MYRRSNFDSLGCFSAIFMIIFVLSIIALFATGLMENFVINEYTATVTDKVVDRGGEGSTYLIFTELSDGSVRVFKNDDAFFFGKFNSSDVQAKLKVGSTYNFRVKGWRIPFWSMYENIISFSEVK